ncbi:hypothetical protein [Mesorhizobium amorphae]|uniref:hypothetical protein n=1 Tax=Mesorhizobium amorphae TaxID=71433 RepID=UPI00177C9A1D|nr:hypothetical protein [Mesorhizobium amorphae]
MRPEDRVRKGVVYVGILAGDTFVPLGTGFMTFGEVDKAVFPFVVTARHVLSSVKESATTKIGVRMNLNSGGSQFIPVPLQRWKAHPEDACDLMMAQIAPDPSAYDYQMTPCDLASIKEAQTAFPPAIGREVFIAGLYTSHHGAVKNIPILRNGHIAAMPEEPVRTSVGYTDGYLVEMRSIAGLSAAHRCL